jgi:uncharacterized protein YegJ (DUF2314 family)
VRKLITILALCAIALTSVAVSSKPGTALGTGSISGIITDATTGQPIEGAKVMARMGRSMATTASDGSYTLGGLSAGEYTVQSMKMGAYSLGQYPTVVHLAEGEQVTGIDIALTPITGGGNGSISGVIYDEATNQPIVGAQVMVSGCGNVAISGNDGAYTISGLADGSYTVRAMKAGYACGYYPNPVVISGGNSVTGIDIYLTSASRASPKRMRQAK